MSYTYLFDLFNNSDDSLVTGWTGVSVTGLMLNVTGLPQATEYYYKIKQKYTTIYGTEIISAYSDRRNVATLNFNDTITNLSGNINSINYEGFIFNFNRYSLPTYKITVAQGGLPLSNYNNRTVTGTSLSVTGLTNSLSYDVSVNISYNALEEIETYTQTIPTISAPSSVATSGSPSATGFTAQWTNASGITQNLFYLSVDNFATYIISGQVVTGNSFSVTGLTALTSYKYALRSYLNGLYGVQQGALSSVVEVTTAVAGSIPTIPTGVAVSGVTSTSGSVYWSSVDTVTGYSGVYSANNFVTGTTFTTTGTSFSMTPLVPNTAYKARVKAVNNFGESAFSSEVSFTTVSSDDFTNQNWDLWYGKTSMVGSGTNLANQSPTTINATITSPSWEASAKWGNGLNLNSSGRLITIPHNAIYKVSGVNAQICLATVVTIKTLETSTFRTIYQTQGIPNTQINFYIAFNASQRLFLVMELVDNSQFSNPSILDMRSTPSLVVSTNQNLGIAYRVDLQNSVIEFIINQTVYSYTITTGASYYNSIADFKTAGGINPNTLNVLAVQSPITLQRYAIKKGVSGTLISSTDIMAEFSQMGLT